MGKKLLSLVLALSFNVMAWSANHGNVLEININNDDLEVELAKMKAWSRNSQTFFGAGFLKSYDEDDVENLLYYATLTQVGYTDIRGFSFGIGFRGIYSELDEKANPIKDEKKNTSALAARAKLLYTLPLRVKTIISATYNYAPKSLCFSNDLTAYREYRLEINAEPIDGGWLYAGLRDIEFEFDDDKVPATRDNTYTLNHAGYVGFKLYF